MKAKFIALALAISVLTGCSQSITASMQPPATEKYDIDFDANYDKENAEIIATLTNNTVDDIINYYDMYKIYKKAENGWITLRNGYNSFSTFCCVFPDNDIMNSVDIKNSADISFSAYNLPGENEGLSSGEYKIDMTINVYYEAEANNLSVDPYDPHEQMTISAEFTVK